MQVHDYHSYEDSIRHKLNIDSWRRGQANFFVEKVPFSFSTSYEYAQFCVDLLGHFQANSDQKLSLIEAGSGLGLLAKKMDDKFKKDLPNQAIDLCLSEYSDDFTAQLEDIDFVKFRSNLHCQTLDISKPNFDRPYNVMLLTYVWDVLPGQVLRYDNGSWFECQLSCHIDDEATINDTTTIPFKTLSASDIKDLLSNDISDQHLGLISAISELIEDKWESRPIDISDLKYATYLNDIIDDYPDTKSFYLHYSEALLNSIHDCIDALDDEFMMICHDLAHVHPEAATSEQHCISEFGLCRFYFIPYYLLKSICKEKGLSFITSNYDESDNQIAVLTSLKNDEALAEIRKQLEGEEPGKRSYEAAKKLHIGQALSDDEKSALSYDQARDYHLLYCNALALFNEERYEDCIMVIRELLIDYEITALNAYILCSKALRKCGRQQQALEVLDEIKHTKYDAAYLEQVFCHAELKQFEQMKEAIKAYFEVATYKTQEQLLALL